MGEAVYTENDRAFTAYRNPENSDSNYGDAEKGEEGEKKGNSSAISNNNDNYDATNNNNYSTKF